MFHLLATKKLRHQITKVSRTVKLLSYPATREISRPSRKWKKKLNKKSKENEEKKNEERVQTNSNTNYIKLTTTITTFVT